MTTMSRKTFLKAAGACALTSLVPAAAFATLNREAGEEVVFKPLFGLGEPNDAYAKYFSGKSWLNSLADYKVAVANVTFGPGCRNDWHVHHKGGQILLCTDGRGWYQVWGEPARELKPGDAVAIPAEIKHWHGAAKDSFFTHIAIAVPAEGASTEWLEPVSDPEYAKLG